MEEANRLSPTRTSRERLLPVQATHRRQTEQPKQRRTSHRSRTRDQRAESNARSWCVAIGADSQLTAHRVEPLRPEQSCNNSKESGERTWHKPLTPQTKPSSAVTVGSDHWTAEWFVPWSCIGGRPKPNESRRATLLRLRPTPYEYTTWEAMVNPNLWDTERLGTWIFAAAR